MKSKKASSFLRFHLIKQAVILHQKKLMLLQC